MVAELRRQLMLRIIVAGAAIAIAALSSSALAADMPVKAPRVAAPIAPTWTGWNAGISLGAQFANITGKTLSFGGAPPTFPAFASQDYDSTTFRVGGYLGYDWQFNPNWLVGLEGDFAWGAAKKHVDALQGIAPSGTGSSSKCGRLGTPAFAPASAIWPIRPGCSTSLAAWPGSIFRRPRTAACSLAVPA
jgi:opacity protein-like surface antigen